MITILSIVFILLCSYRIDARDGFEMITEKNGLGGPIGIYSWCFIFI